MAYTLAGVCKPTDGIYAGFATAKACEERLYGMHRVMYPVFDEDSMYVKKSIEVSCLSRLAELKVFRSESTCRQLSQYPRR